MDQTDKAVPSQSNFLINENIPELRHRECSGFDVVEGPPPRSTLQKIRMFKHLYKDECTVCFEHFSCKFFKISINTCVSESIIKELVDYHKDTGIYTADHYQDQHGPEKV